MPRLSITDHLRLTLGDVADVASRTFFPSVRLGVTGLSRAGKTVFITALVHAFLKGGRLPLFEPLTLGSA